VAEADVPPMQLQGPRAADVMRAVGGDEVAGLERFRCAPAVLSGVECVVSNTGWSREPGYEIYPLGSARAAEVWDALTAAGEPHGLLVTGPNIVRAVEQGIFDTQYATNSGMDPLEASLGVMLDLDRPDLPPFPVMERHWPVRTPDGTPAGVARWAVYSFTLERNIAVALVDAALDPADGFTVEAPDGGRHGVRHAIPFV
jgi:glycine cleavage system aminomethyltransferase T